MPLFVFHDHVSWPGAQFTLTPGLGVADCEIVTLISLYYV